MTNQEAMIVTAMEWLKRRRRIGEADVRILAEFALQEVASRDALLEKIRQTVALMPSATHLSPPPDFESIPMAIRDLQNAYLDAAKSRDVLVPKLKDGLDKADHNLKLLSDTLTSRDARIAELEQELADRDGIILGLQDLNAGRVRPLDEIEAELRKKHGEEALKEQP